MLLCRDTRQDGAWTEGRNSPETPAYTAKQASQDGRTGQDFGGNSVNSCGDSLLNRCGLLQIGLLFYLYSNQAVGSSNLSGSATLKKRCVPQEFIEGAGMSVLYPEGGRGYLYRHEKRSDQRINFQVACHYLNDTGILCAKVLCQW